MGCYGIGIERILTAAIEQSNDENGFWLPPPIAPFEIVVTPTNVADAKLQPLPKTSPRRLEQPVTTCYWTTATNGQGLSSRTLTWWAYPSASTSARRLPKVWQRSFNARLAKVRMLASAQ